MFISHLALEPAKAAALAALCRNDFWADDMSPFVKGASITNGTRTRFTLLLPMKMIPRLMLSTLFQHVSRPQWVMLLVVPVAPRSKSNVWSWARLVHTTANRVRCR